MSAKFKPQSERAYRKANTFSNGHTNPAVTGGNSRNPPGGMTSNRVNTLKTTRYHEFENFHRSGRAPVCARGRNLTATLHCSETVSAVKIRHLLRTRESRGDPQARLKSSRTAPKLCAVRDIVSGGKLIAPWLEHDRTSGMRVLALPNSA